MMSLLFLICKIYVIGYITTFILMCLGANEEKAHGIKQHAQWGAFFAIIWPITLPITIYCIPATIKGHIRDHQYRKCQQKARQRSINKYPPQYFSQPIPSELIKDAFHEPR